MAADESAVSPSTDGMTVAIAAATKTAELRRVSAHTCYEKIQNSGSEHGCSHLNQGNPDGPFDTETVRTVQALHIFRLTIKLVGANDAASVSITTPSYV